MKNTIYETKLSFGLEFESEMIQVVSEYYRGLYQVVSEMTFRTSTKEEDLYLGTDFFAEGIPVDATLAIDDKDHCTMCPKVYSLGAHDVKFGIRYGNNWNYGSNEFEKPVLVICITNIARNYLMNVMEDVRKVIGEIIDMAVSFYYETVDPDPIEAEAV